MVAWHWSRRIGSAILVLTMLALGRTTSADEPTRGPPDVTNKFVVPEGMQVTVWARTPLFYNPTNIDIDARGRVWVAEAVNYRNFRTRPLTPPSPPRGGEGGVRGKYDGLVHPGGDRIVILEDTDGDGAADKSTVFVQDKDLVAPMGIAVIGQQVIVSCSPHLIVYTDEDGDDKPDRKEILLTGFGGHDHDHGLHALVGGPDGRWYCNVGNAGPHLVKDKAGWRLRSGSSYAGGSPHNNQNTSGLKSDDGRVWVGGLAFRLNPDGTGLKVIGHNFRNAYELCVDSFGNVWQNDNDDTISCRTTWLMEGGNLGFASADGTRSWQADQRPGQSIPTAHWRQEDPGVIPAGDVYGPGAPTGIVCNEGDALGTKYRGLLLSCEAGRNVVWGYLPKPAGAGYKLERFPFLASVKEDDPNYVWHKLVTDPRKFFRPSDVAIGPDGAVYVADWYDPIVGGHQMHDKKCAGIIYRIAPKDRKLAVPKLDLASISGQITALKNPAVNVRYLAFQALKKRGTVALPAVQELLADPNPFFRARAVWLAAQLGPEGSACVEKLLGDTDPNLRITAFRALRQTRPSVLAAAGVLAKDQSPAVRREVALALRDVLLEQCRPLVLELAAGYDGQDRWYLEALGTACEGKEDALYPDLQKRLGAEPLQWSEAFAGLMWRLRPAVGIGAWAQRARAPALSAGARRQAVDALAFMKQREAAQAMLELALGGPDDVRPYATWWLRNRSSNDWKDYQLARFLGSDPLLDPTNGKGPKPPNEPVFISPVVKYGSIEIDVDITGAKRLWLVANDAGNGFSCDWADWIAPRLVGPESSVKLTDLKWVYGDCGYGRIHVNKNCQGLPLRVGGQAVAEGIGTHANSTIVFNIPQGKGQGGFARFQAHAGIDNGGQTLGGSDYPNSPASVRFLVYHDGPSPRAVAAAQSKKLLGASLGEAEKQELALAMAQTAAGGRMLLYLAARRQLPNKLKTTVAAKIFHNPDLSVRALASEYFPRSGAASNLPPIGQLAALPGDQQRGRTVFFSDKAGCARCHTFAGQGADVGPDLTQIALKFDRTALLDAILNPSAAILVGYEAWLITTEKGELFTGFILADADPLILKDSDGRLRTIPKNMIAERQHLKQSLMPDNVAVGLRAQELADLTTFLMSRPAAKK